MTSPVMLHRIFILSTAVLAAVSMTAEGMTTRFGGISTNVEETAAEILAAIGRNHHYTNLTTPEMIIESGYPAEIHKVTTEDGYILELHRIPHGINETDPDKRKRRPVAFLHHCLLCSSSDFIMNAPHKALAYMLADKGYDVWLTNARGNTYSKNHVTLSPEDKEFWQFSWHEMGYYDLPAAIDHVLDETGQDDLNYIGFSMGTTVFWVLMSERPEYASKIKFMAALGPVAYVENMEGPLRYLAWFPNLALKYMEMLGRHEVFSFGPVMDYLVSYVCDEDRYTAAICHNSLFFITGANPKQLNKEFLPVILSHTPAGTSARTLFHYLQEVKSGKFRKFDHGESKNLELYGTEEPPSYDLTRATPPVAIFWSNNDWLASAKDVLHLLSSLPNCVEVRRVVDDKFTHLDFIWAIEAAELLYNPLLEIMSRYQDEDSGTTSLFSFF